MMLHRPFRLPLGIHFCLGILDCLCVKIFMKDPQLAPDVKEGLPDKSNQTVSRAKLICCCQYRSNSHFSSHSLSSSSEEQASSSSSKCQERESDAETRGGRSQAKQSRFAWVKVESAKALSQAVAMLHQVKIGF